MSAELELIAAYERIAELEETLLLCRDVLESDCIEDERDVALSAIEHTLSTEVVA